MSDATLAELTALVLKFRDERDWKQFHNPKDMAIALAVEAAELLELVQWRSGEALAERLADRREDLSDELADVLFWVLEIAHESGIDLAAAFRAKMAKNAAKYPAEKVKGSPKKYNEYE